MSNEVPNDPHVARAVFRDEAGQLRPAGALVLVKFEGRASNAEFPSVTD